MKPKKKKIKIVKGISWDQGVFNIGRIGYRIVREKPIWLRRNKAGAWSKLSKKYEPELRIEV